MNSERKPVTLMDVWYVLQDEAEAVNLRNVLISTFEDLQRIANITLETKKVNTTEGGVAYRIVARIFFELEGFVNAFGANAEAARTAAVALLENALRIRGHKYPSLLSMQVTNRQIAPELADVELKATQDREKELCAKRKAAALAALPAEVRELVEALNANGHEVSVVLV